MKTKKLIKTNQKPISLDLHLKYRCPNVDCGYTHWLSLQETQTKNFQVVCDCGLVFSPKRIQQVRIKYHKKKIISKIEEQTELTPEIKNSIEVSVLEKCVKALIQYGFTKLESEDLVNRSFEIVQNNDIGLIMKKCLELIGENKI